MTKSFAMELGPLNIRVNALLPGLTDTKFASALTSNEAIKKQAMAHIPMKRVANPDEMAAQCCIWYRPHPVTPPVLV